jgi:hypothetical protein
MVVLFGVPWGGIIIYLGVAIGSTLRPRSVVVTLAALATFTTAWGLAAGAGLSNIAFEAFLTTALGVTMLAFRRLLQLVNVLSASSDGSTIVAIARRLSLSEGTVRNYLSSAIQKTGTHNRTEALRRAETSGWL